MTSPNLSRAIGNAGPFDLLIVGAGPAAAATLMGLKEVGRICVLTGATVATMPKLSVPPKIRIVAEGRGEPAGITDPIAIANNATLAYSTAAIGGLANYWGQQFIRYLSTDPWPRCVFANYEGYQASCARNRDGFHGR